MAIKNPPVDTSMAFACAAGAQRINGRYLNMESKGATDQTNREIMVDLLQGKLELTDADRESGEKIRNHFNGLLFKKLVGKLNGFEQNIAELLDKDSVPFHKLGIIAALPASYAREVKKEETQETIIKVAGSSQHLQNNRGPLQMVIKVVDSVRLALYNCWTVTAVTEQGNLVGFYMKTDPKELGTEYTKIRARVKGFSQYKGNVPITYLNYVKPLEVKTKENVCDSLF